jgi:hypothetical protein
MSSRTGGGVERTVSGMEQNRRMRKDDERLCTTSATGHWDDLAYGATVSTCLRIFQTGSQLDFIPLHGVANRLSEAIHERPRNFYPVRFSIRQAQMGRCP